MIKNWLAEYAVLYHKGEDPDSEVRETLNLMELSGIDFPVVVKPDIGSNGYICSVTLRYYPFVTGDGSSTIRELIQKDQRARVRKDFYLKGNSMHRGFDPELIDLISGKGELIRLSFIGSLRTGGLYRNDREIITQAHASD